MRAFFASRLSSSVGWVIAFISPLPAQSRTSCDRHFQIFKAYHGQRRLRCAQLEGVTRRIFFDPSLSFDPTTLKPRCSAGAEALTSTHKKWSVQLSYSPTMTEMDRRH